MHDLWSISYLAGGIDAAPTPIVDVQAGSYSETVTDTNDVSMTVSFSNTGLVSVVGGSGPTYAWLTDGTASDYSIFVQVNSGAFTVGTTGSWVNLGATSSWNLSQTVVGTSSVTATVSIRRDSDGLTLDSADITLTATVNAGETGAGGDGYSDPPGGGNGGHLP